MKYKLAKVMVTTKKTPLGFENIQKLVFESVPEGEFTYSAKMTITLDEDDVDPWDLDRLLCGDELTFRREGTRRMKALDTFTPSQKK